MWITYRVDSHRRRRYARSRSLGFWGRKPLSQKSLCSTWSYAPEHAAQFASVEEAQLAADQMSVAIRRPGAMQVTTLAEAVERASKGWTRRNNRSTVRTGG